MTSRFDAVVAAGGEAVQITYHELPPNKFTYLGLVSLDTVSNASILLMAGNNKGGGRIFDLTVGASERLVFISRPDLHAWFGFERLTFRRVDADRLEISYDFSRDGADWTVGDVQIFARRADAQLGLSG